VDWSSLTTGDIEKIEVIRGAASAQYENSQGGIINIITKKGKKRDTLVPKVSLTTDFSRVDTFAGRSTVDGGVGDLGYFFNIGYKESDGYLLNNNYHGYDFSGRANYSFPFQGTLLLGLKGSYLKHGFAVVNDPDSLLVGDLYNPDYPIVPEDSDTVRRYRYTSFPGGENYKEKQARHMDISYEQPVKNMKLKLQLFKTTGQEDAYYYRAVMSGGALVLQPYYSGGDARKEAQTGGRFQMIFDQWTNHNLVAGYDQRRMEVESKPDVWRMNAVYVEDTWNFAKKWSSFFGLRYAHIREWTYEYKETPTSPSERHLLKTVEWLPKSTLTYHLSPDTEVFVSVNRDYHVPGC
jgi:iron complex outermembrane receptor protein